MKVIITRGLIVSILGLGIIFSFQNCSQAKFKDSSIASSSTEPSEQINEVQSTNKENDNQLSEVAKIDELSCFRDYFSVYANPGNSETMTNLQFLKAIKIYTEDFPERPKTDYGFTVSSKIINSGPGTQVYTKFLKKENADPDYLTCYFPSSNPIKEFRNIGIDQTTNVLNGYLSSKQKFIRCYIESGNQKIIFQSADGKDLTLDKSTPFVIKRGCKSY